MAEILGLIASIVQLTDAITKIVKYINGASGFHKESISFAEEASGIINLLLRLRLRLQDAQANPVSVEKHAWNEQISSTLRALMMQIEEELRTMIKILSPSPTTGCKTLKRTLAWPISKEIIRGSLSRIERLKGLVSLALDDELSELAKAIKRDTALLKPLQNDVTSVIGQIDYVASKIETLDVATTHARQLRHEKLVNFIAPHDFSQKYESLLQERLEGTGRWFLESPEFKEWESGNGGLLWCPGMPGAGKSILCAISIDYIQRAVASQKGAAVLFAFCDYRQQFDQTRLNLLASLWRQLLQRRHLDHQECNELEAKFEGAGRRLRPTPLEMLEMLYKELTRYTQVYIFIDGLDELGSTARHEFTQALCTLQNMNKSAAGSDIVIRDCQHSVGPNPSSLLNILVTSRLSGHQTQHFRHVPHLELRASDEDLRKYISSRLRAAESRRLAKHIAKDRTLIGDMQETVIRKAQGMFLLARLHIGALADKHTVKAVRKALEALPEGKDAVSETYDEAMTRIEGQNPDDKELAFRVISWVLRCREPLHLIDLQHAFTVDPYDHELDEEDLIPALLIISVCAGLVTLEPQTGIVRFVHYTAQEYFDAVRSSRFPLADADISRTSLAYLTLDHHSFDPSLHTIEEFNNLVKGIPFLEYAAKYWGEHTRAHFLAENGTAARSTDDSTATCRELQSLVDDFFDHRNQMCCAVRILLCASIKDYGGGIGLAVRTHFNSIKRVNVCAYFGLNTIILEHLKQEPDALTHSNDGFFGNVIHWATLGDHEDTLRMLIRRDECRHLVNARAFCEEIDHYIPFKARIDHAPLHLAAYQGRSRAVRVLLESEADPALENRFHYTPIQVAAHSGNTESLSAILSTVKGQETLLVRDHLARSSLFETAIWGQTEAARLLVKAIEHLPRGITVKDSLHDYSGRNPLHYAAERNWPDTVRILLESPLGVQLAFDIDETTDMRPVHEGIYHGCTEVTRIFLEWEHATELFRRPDGVERAFHIAASGGHAGVLTLLLESIPDALGILEATETSTLHLAARSGVVEAVKAVAEKLHSKDLIDREDLNGQTALANAASRGHTEVIEYLVHFGANPRKTDKSGQTPLHLGARSNLHTVVDLLLTLGAVDLEASDIHGQTALALAVEHQHMDVARLLLHAGAKVLRIPTRIPDALGIRSVPWIQMPQLSEDIRAFGSPPRRYVPTQARDQFEAAFYLKFASGWRLSPSIIGYIFDLAGYWLEKRVQTVEPLIVSERGSVLRDYVRSPLLTGYPNWPVRRLRFTASSYEESIVGMAWSGSDQQSYTWWEAGKIEGNTAAFNQRIGPQVQTGPICFWNTHHGPHAPQTKTCVWPKTVHGFRIGRVDDSEATDPVVFTWGEENSDAACAQWVRQLRPGQRVILSPQTAFANKFNHVYSAELEISSSFLKR